MFQIGFGLFLFHILMFLLWPVVILLVVPFILNLFDGRGYGYNFKKVWGGLWWFLSLGFKRRD